MDFKSIEEVLGYEFNKKELLKQAFVRASYSNEQKEKVCNNEILEFYGDSVLNFIVIKLLFEKESILTDKGLESNRNEESLSNAIRYWTCKTKLSTRIDSLGLSRYIISSNGDMKNDINNQPSVKEDLFEALVCALWIDSDYNLEKIKDTVKKMLDFKFIDIMYEKDIITLLKEWCDKNDASYILKESIIDGFFLATLIVYIDGKEKKYENIGISKERAIEDVYNKVLMDLHKYTKSIEIQFDCVNAASRLNELIQKKIVTIINSEVFEVKINNKIKHRIEYDTLEYGFHYGSGDTKSEAKNKLSFSILTCATKGISDMNKDAFDIDKK